MEKGLNSFLIAEDRKEETVCKEKFASIRKKCLLKLIALLRNEFF